jgi:hypothetical protein
MQRVLEVLVVALFVVGCGTSQPGGQAQYSPRETPPEAAPPAARAPAAASPAAVQVDFMVTGESRTYQATQTIGVESQQLITSTRYTMIVSIF